MSEEKKLTDEKALFNYIANDVLGQVKPLYLRKRIVREIFDLIHRLQKENEKLKPKKILANRVYSDATLKGWKKEDLIEQIRILEHNWSCAEESLNNSVKNSEKIFVEQKAELERLTEELKKCGQELIDSHREQEELQDRNAELQKQVDELKGKVKEQQREIRMARGFCIHEKRRTESARALASCKNKIGLAEQKRQYKRGYDKAVKDTAKEIYSEIGDDDILVISTQEYGKIEVVPLERLQEIVKAKGVEVE